MRAANWSWCVLVATATAGPSLWLSPTPGPSDVLLSHTLDWGNLLTWTLATMPSPSLLLLMQRIDKEWKKAAKWANSGHTLTFSRVLPYFARLSNTRNVTIYPRQSTRSLLFPVWPRWGLLGPRQDFFIENINLSLHRFITRVTNNQPDQHKTRGPNAKPLQESANIKFVVLKVQEVYRKIKKIINIGNYSKDLHL